MKIAGALVLVPVLCLAGCNRIKGAGQDLSNVAKQTEELITNDHDD